MRKKSHISLAMHIVRESDYACTQKHRKAFYVGSVLPDCKPTFLTRRHEIDGTFFIVEKNIKKLTTTRIDAKLPSTMYYTRLGEVLHYIADYFTFPHNKEFDGTMKAHCIYEGKLKHELKAYVEDMDSSLDNGDRPSSRDYQGNDALLAYDIDSVETLLEYIRLEHSRYIAREHHSVEDDVRLIVAVCDRIAKSILRLCMEDIRIGELAYIG